MILIRFEGFLAGLQAVRDKLQVEITRWEAKITTYKWLEYKALEFRFEGLTSSQKGSSRTKVATLLTAQDETHEAVCDPGQSISQYPRPQIQYLSGSWNQT